MDPQPHSSRLGGSATRTATLKKATRTLGLLLLYAPPHARASTLPSGDEFYPHNRGRRIVFSVHAPVDADVSLVGDFNDWQVGSTPLQYVGESRWETALRLDEGIYEYKFVVDGSMRLDASNPEEVVAADGSVRSRIRVQDNGRVSHYNRWPQRRRVRERLPTRITLEPRDHARLSFGGDYSYTRVDGSMLWLTASYWSSFLYAPELRTRFGYGFQSENWTFEADFAQPIVPGRTLDLGVFYAYGTGFENQSGIGWRENTLAALFFRHDFNDYYKIEGIEPYLRLRLPGWSTLRLSYAVEKYDSLTSQTRWSFFTAGRSAFRPNPALFLLTDPDGHGGAGTLRATRLELVHDSRRARYIGTVGSLVRGFVEFGEGDFSYGRWVGDGRAYLRLGPPVHLSTRFAVGGRFGDDRMPSQKLFYVGGLGTVRGHEFRGLYGDHMLLGNLEYTLLFDDFDFGALAFYDVGTAWNSTQQNLEDATVLQSVGFGLKTSDNDFQIHFAKPIGQIEGGLETTVRLQRTF